ncbi:MAG: von Willebrand factor type A domain-containing protein [Sedimentisphaerales bacterium]|nr:von Willebrand factor type A domain-containing protein [Sedimentisphaerales bacterium]
MKSKPILEQNIARLIKRTREQPQPSEAFREELIEEALLRLAMAGPKERTTMQTILQLTTAIAAVLLISFGVILFGPPDPTQESLSVKDNQSKSPTATGSKSTGQIASDVKPKTAEMAALPLELPKPMFVGTPASLQGVPRLEKPRNQGRPPFYAPKGTTNVALGKPVASTDPMPIMGDLFMITDGDKEAADGSYVELGPFQQSITIDLEAEYNIYAILFWHFHKQTRVYYDVVVQVSTDPDFINAITLFNNDHDNSAGLGAGTDLHYVENNEGKLIDAKGYTARYVRLISQGNTANDLNHYIEVEAWGLPTDASKSKQAVEQKIEPLPIVLPKPMFVGTPENLHLHPPRPHSQRQTAEDFLKEQVRPSLLSDRTIKPEPQAKSRPTLPPAQPAPRSEPTPPAKQPMAHGGTTPPNSEPADAMFFRHYGVNAFIDTEDDPLSTFAIDVDTGSYTICRSYLRDGHIPPAEAVRVEEFVNYFDYAYPAPQEQAFAVFADAAQWTFGSGRKNSYLLRIGIKGQQVPSELRKPAILTFVIDVSGSMNRENRLGLVKQSLRILVDQLHPDDRIGIATYGSRGQKVMDHVSLRYRDHILSVIDRLKAGGSTFAEEGIRIGYEMAQKEFREGYINRVILCSDGVANVGKTGPQQILQTIQEGTKAGITLSALGFGMGNYNDTLLEQLGDKGNGHYAYIDTLGEAQRLFGESLTSILQVIARDVKVQVDFNPKVVRSYRLIGYENRDVPDDKFRDDRQDGGEIGAGHACTALYEIKLWDQPRHRLAEMHIRYKDPDTDETIEVVAGIGPEDFHEDFNTSPLDLQLATTIAEFAEILRKSPWAGGATLDSVQEKIEGIQNQWTGNKNIEELAGLIRQAIQLRKKETTDAFSKAETSEPEDLIALP